MRMSVRTASGVAPLLIGGILAAPAYATDIFGAEEAAAELPQVWILMRRPADPTPPDQVTPIGFDGDFAPVLAYLDTGASGILISSGTAHPDFGLDIHNEVINGQPVKFFDTGATETAEFHVSELLDFEIAHYPGPSDELSFDDMATINETFNHIGRVRTQMTPQPDSILDLSTTDIVGMPAMVNKVTVIDARLYNRPFDTNDPNAPLPVIRTFVQEPGTPYNPAADDYTRDDVIPGIPQTERTVKLTFENFDAFSHVDPTGAPRPNTADNPFIGASPLNPNDPNAPPGVSLFRAAGPGNNTVDGNFLLDTGAQVSFMSSAKAAGLGVVDFNPATGDQEFDADGFPILFDSQTGSAVPYFSTFIQGASGDAVGVSGFYTDYLSIPTEEGDPLVFHNASFLIIDIELEDALGNIILLDGAIGSSFLMPTFDINTLDLVGGPFDWVVFDEPNAELRFAFAPYVPEPSAVSLLMFASTAVLARRRRRASAA